ncbi:MAG: SNF2-related protein [Legionellales bacterium]|nr:SNF2-related protein [Legionellales bacterium]
MMSNVLSTLTNSAIKSAYTSATHHKGKSYYAAHRVVDLHITHPSTSESLVNAQVQGTTLYTVSIRIADTKHVIRLEGDCSCPLQRDCKHIVAALLQAVDHNASISAVTKSNVIPFSQKAKPDITDDPRVTHWLRQLQHVMASKSAAPVPIDETYGLYYVLSKIVGETHQLGVEPLLVRRLKAGGLGTPKPYSETAFSLQKHLHPIDKELLAKLDVIKKTTRYHGYSPKYCLHGESGEVLLHELINTGRCHWRTVHTKSLSLAQPKSVELRWDIDDQGMQTLRFGVPDQQYPILFIEQPWYFDESQSTCGVLNTSLDHNIAKLLLSAPKIPPAQVEAVVDFFSQHDRVASVKPPKKLSKRRIQNRKPVPCLRLFQAPIRSMYFNQYGSAPDAMKALADVSFDYDGTHIPWQNSNETINQVQDDQLITLVRNKPFELNAMKELMQCNALVLSSIPEFSRAIANEKWVSSLLIEHATSDPLVFSTKVVPKLRQAGWQIEFDAQYPYQIIDEPIEEWYSSIREESSEYDWFGLELGITVKGEKINLLPVIQTLLKQWKSRDLSQADDSEPVYARLPNGHYIPLPANRVKNLLNVLIELYDSDSLSDEQELRLSKLHASRLLELDAAMGAAQLRWIGGDRIREMARKLANFNRIQQAEVPKQFLAELRPYQLEGLSWLQFLREYEFGGILADDMGLGKTVQALAHITLEKTSGRMTQPCLVIAPTSLMFNWQMEAKRFSPKLKVLLLHGADRKEQFDSIADYDLILTTYPLIVRQGHPSSVFNGNPDGKSHG